MNQFSTRHIATALLIVLIGAGGVLYVGGGWVAAVIAAVAGAAALFTLHEQTVSDPGADDTPRLILEPEALPRLEPGAIVEGVPEPLLIIEHGRVELANAAARKLLGAHIVGADARIAIRHPAAAERLSWSAPAPEQEAPVELVGLGVRDQRWEMRTASIGPGRTLVSLTDRTGSHATDKIRVDFVANASHELRTPLATISGFLETLSDDEAGGDRDTRNRFLKIMSDEASRMQRLVDDLMSLSRIEAEKYRLPDTRVDLRALAQETIGICRERYGARGQDVEGELPHGLPPVIGDRAQLSQLLHNLIGNAMKYGRPGTPVRVRLAAVAPSVPGGQTMLRLAVTDQGEGIAPDHLPRLTERFYRVDAGRSRAVGGTGLGLAIVKHIVERHHGRLDIVSALGEGTTVTVTLPAALS